MLICNQTVLYVQVHSHRLRLQRRLYDVYIVLMIPYNSELVSPLKSSYFESYDQVVFTVAYFVGNPVYAIENIKIYTLSYDMHGARYSKKQIKLCQDLDSYVKYSAMLLSEVLNNQQLSHL